MTKITPETRDKYKALKARADAAYAAAEPLDAAYQKALEPWYEISNEMEEIIDGTEVETCEGCSELIFAGDKSYAYVEGNACVACAPTYQGMLDEPGMFVDPDGEPLTAEAVKLICDRHVAAGGSLTDSMAT
jgi:hypothetical protein